MPSRRRGCNSQSVLAAAKNGCPPGRSHFYTESSSPVCCLSRGYGRHGGRGVAASARGEKRVPAVAETGATGLEPATSGVAGRARSATILQEAARRSPSSRELRPRHRVLASTTWHAPPAQRSRPSSHRAVVCQDSRARLQPAAVPAGIPATLSTSPGGRGQDRDCPRQGRSERGTAGPIGPGRYFVEPAPMFGIRRSATARATQPLVRRRHHGGASSAPLPR